MTETKLTDSPEAAVALYTRKVSHLPQLGARIGVQRGGRDEPRIIASNLALGLVLDLRRQTKMGEAVAQICQPQYKTKYYCCLMKLAVQVHARLSSL